MERRGISPDQARMVVRTNPTVIAALMVKRRDADAFIVGTIGQYHQHLREVKNIIGLRAGISKAAALNVLVLSKGNYFLADTYVTPEPKAAQLVEMTLLAAEQVRCFGLTPKVALLSHSSFGSHDSASALKMRQVYEELRRREPSLEVEGEMHADAALSEEIRKRIFPNSMMRGSANLLIMPTLDAANIALNLMKELGDGLSIGPLLLGMAQPGHILTPSVTARGIVNATALASQDAQMAMDIMLRPDWLRLDDAARITDLIYRVDSALADETGPAPTARVILFMAARRGDGVSAIAAAYAHGLAEGHKRRVLLLDAGTGRPGLIEKMLREIPPSLVETVALQQPLETSIIKVRPGLSAARLNGSADDSDSTARLIADADFWTALKADYDEVVIDGPYAAASSHGLQMAAAADGVILVVAGEETRLPVAQSLVNDLRAVRANIIGAVFNKRRFYIPDFIYRRL